ncbi:MAG TPA: nitrite/sulfite reductase [Burkholderiales bacterium]|nr:nitrite/sulfite reductase [Burkholderiales bacterium]
MYRYDDIDQQLLEQRVAQFRDQTRRYLAGELEEEQFKQLRLRNGLYIQRHAPMLRVAIPYGLLSAAQLRKLAHIARRYDRGYGHFSTRQNIQFNWPRLEDVPDILAELATVQMHAIQTSGNCIRNVTADHFGGVAPDEVVDPFVWCELIRQWSTLHPEFSWLPRKFKIAVSGSVADRAAILVHDIGLAAVMGTDPDSKQSGSVPGFRVSTGGGLGRTPIVGHVIREFLLWRHLLSYLEAILRLYNRHGRRDNLHKARIKFLVKERGPEAFAREVEAEWAHLKDGPATLTESEVQRVAARFTKPGTDPDLTHQDAEFTLKKVRSVPGFAAWERRNVHPHKLPGYCAVTLSLKKTGVPPGDVSAGQMEAIADLAERYSGDELRVTHEQNLVFADVARRDLPALWQALRALGLATPNVGLLTNIISCPGGDFCSLANARSIPLADAIQRRFDDLDYLFDIGELDLNISGCMNACGHHHVGHIGILGVDKHGEEFYQLEIGGSQGAQAALGRVLGPALSAAEVPDAIERLIEVYLERRDSDAERFVDVVRRIGIEPFKERVYDYADQTSPDRIRPLAAAAG